MKNVNQNNLDSEKLEKYIKEVQAISDLTVEEEKELFEKIAKNSDSEAIEKITKANLKLVVSIIKEYKYAERYPDISLLDLINEGNSGLFKAIKKFDLEKIKSKNYTFKQYATWWIRQAITRSLIYDHRTLKYKPSNLELEKLKKEIKIIKIYASGSRGIPGFIVFIYKDIVITIPDYGGDVENTLIYWLNNIKKKEKREKEQKEKYDNYVKEKIKKPILKIPRKSLFELIKKAMERDRQVKENVIDYWNQSFFNTAKDLAENFLSPHTPLEILQAVEAKLKEAVTIASVHSLFDTEINPAAVFHELKDKEKSLKDYIIKELFFLNGQYNIKRLEAEIKKRKRREEKQKEVLDWHIKEVKKIPDLSPQTTKNLVGKLFVGDKNSENRIYQAYRKMAVVIAQKETKNPRYLKRIITLYELIKIGEKNIKKSIRDFIAESYDVRKNPLAIKGYTESRLEVNVRLACEGRPALEDKNIELFSRAYYL